MGIGVDILSLARFETCLRAENAEGFKRRVFSIDEEKLATSRPDSLRFYAGRFAAKEAVFKALDLSADEIDLTQIEILSDAKGRPNVRLGETLQARGLSVAVSISTENDYVLAVAQRREI